MNNELLRRVDIQDKCVNNILYADAEKERCKRSVLTFIKNWCWTHDPRIKSGPKTIPFTLYDYQEEAILWLEERYRRNEIGLIEKSRDMGVTWMFCCWVTHKWLFESGFTALLGSQKEKKVDNRTSDSIFGKLRLNLYLLPWFLRPNMSILLKDGTRSDSHMKLVNPLNGSEIVGESTNKQFGRSGRASIVVLDEYAFVDDSDSIWKAVGDVSDCIIPMSTVNGKNNQFAKLRHSGHIPILSLHWTKHPNKSQTWYENRKKKMEPHQVAQELDIDYDASATGRVYKTFAKHLHVSPEIIYPNPWAENFITWDFGIGDSMTMIFGQIAPEGKIQIYANYDVIDQDIEFFLPMTRGSRPPEEFWHFLTDTEKERINKLLEKVYTCPDTGAHRPLDFEHYGDHSGTARSPLSRRTIKQRMEQFSGIELKTNRDQTFANRIQCYNNLLRCKKTAGGRFVSRLEISPDCQGVIDAHLTYVWDSEDPERVNKPKHNWASHYMSSLEFFAINRFPLEQEEESTSERYR